MKKVTITLRFTDRDVSELTIYEYETQKEIKVLEVKSGNEYCMYLDRIHEKYEVVTEK